MKTYAAATYGDRIAGIYDDWYASVDPAVIDTLAELAGNGAALELGIGTGRVALPLAERGVAVHGLDASHEMVRRMREKARGAEIPVTFGDFADVSVNGEFALVYVVFNTFFALLTQEDQVRCFQGVARRLSREGSFVIEAFVPDVARFHRGQLCHASWVNTDAAMMDLSRVDPVTQRINSQHVLLTPEGMRMYPVQIRYAWPSELDLMARLAGMRLRDRWSGWSKEPFSAESQRHVSVYVPADVAP